MKLTALKTLLPLPSPAWFLAGLVLFAAPLRAEDPPAARRPAPNASSGQALVEARELQQLKEAIDSAARQAEERLQEQARRLSRVASAVDEGAASLRGADEALARLQTSMESLRTRMGSVELKAQALDVAAGKAAVDDHARDSRLDALAKELAALKAELGGSRDSLEAGMKEFAATKADLKERGAKLESLSDLLAVMKRDVENNNEELVEVKQSLKRLEAAAPASGGADDNAAWWDQALRWKYLPAVATGLSVVAVGIAAFHK